MCTPCGEGHDLKSGLGFVPLVECLGEVSHTLKGSCNFATQVRREAKTGKDWVGVGQATLD